MTTKSEQAEMKLRLNDQVKKNIEKIEVAFAASGIDKAEARALAKTYYLLLCNKHTRELTLKNLDGAEFEVPENPLDDLE